MDGERRENKRLEIHTQAVDVQACCEVDGRRHVAVAVDAQEIVPGADGRWFAATEPLDDASSSRNFSLADSGTF